MRTNTSPETLRKALAIVNAKYDQNVEFNRFDINKRSVDFTLRVRNSRKPGARRSWTGRRTVAACWHAHGRFFEAILELDPDAKIVSRGGPGATITRHGGNWQDCNIGSVVQPCMMSSACDCH